ncbi:hypothetical protein Tco_0220662, partial [Tanacetum coccineum]
MHSEGQNLPLTKLTNTVKGTYILRIEIPDTMIDDAFNKSTGYNNYKDKKAESKNVKAAEEPEEQHESLVKIGRGKCYIRSGDQEENIPIAFKKNSPEVEDLAVHSMLDLRKGSKASRIESMKQMKQVVAREGSSATYNKYREFENISSTYSDATQDSYCSNTNEERDDGTDDFDDSDMDLSEDEPKGDD